MKYRFRSSSKNELHIKNVKNRHLKAKRHRYSLTLNSKPTVSEKEKIRFASLFEYATIEGDTEKNRRKLLRKQKRKIFFRRFGKALKAIGRALIVVLTLPLIPIKKWLQKEKEPLNTKMLLGALSSVLLVSLVSSLVIFLSFFSSQFKSYKTVSIPSLVGTVYESEMFDTASVFEYTVEYEYSDLHPSGTIIKQSPEPQVERRSYRGEPIVISLTVCQGRRSYLLDSLVGLPVRDARLHLKNAGVSTEVIYEYSLEHPQGTVIKTIPEEGQRLFSDDKAQLYVSLGERINYISVPYLLGMNETTAISKLRSIGLSVGKVTYIESQRPAGTVISQFPSQYTEISEGSSVSLTVSAGFSYSPRRIPDLYGMTVEDARRALVSVGISIGGIFSMSSALPRGTVVSQSIPPNTDITPSMSEVDIYISS
ncbi:MAG: PASTA domain-containing protein [Clostridia bacterium]|nr:PASTA domain-containing protein [Clostridia bacterium]